jgi:hypothetical protein
MGFHQYNTDFTLDPRVAMTEHKNVSRGLGNQVTVEFNLLYRFHCAISQKDEKYVEDFMKEFFQKTNDRSFDPKSMSLQEFLQLMGQAGAANGGKPPTEPWDQEFGLQQQPELCFKRNPITKLFEDQQMIDQLKEAMNDPIGKLSIFVTSLPRYWQPRGFPQTSRAASFFRQKFYSKDLRMSLKPNI